MPRPFVSAMTKRTNKAVPQTVDPKAKFMAVGSSGLRQFGGYLDEEPLADLKGTRGTAKYREMTTDAIVGAGLLVIKLLIRQSAWSVVPASQRPEDLEAADFLRSCRDDMDLTWSQFIDEVLSMLEFGYSIHEKIYKQRNGMNGGAEGHSRFADGRIGWRTIELRSQDTIEKWEFDKSNRPIAAVQFDQTTYRWLTIPLDKCLLFRPHTHKNSPEGRSILRSAYDSWYNKTQIRRFEGIGIERDLAGLPRVRVPGEILADGASAQQKAVLSAYKDMATQIRRNRQAAIVIPSDRDEQGNFLYDFDLISSGGARQFDTDKTIARYNKEIALSMLADVILVGHEAAGSYALASSKTNLMSVSLGAYMDAIQDVINRQAVPELFVLNPEFRIDALPTFQHSDVETPNLQELAQWISTLSLSGVDLSDGATQAWLRKVAGMPEVEFEPLAPSPEEPESTELEGE